MTLIDAIKAGVPEEIEKALAETPDINARDEKNLTALMHACQKKDLATVMKILSSYPEAVEIDMDDSSVNHKLALMMLAPISGDAQEAARMAFESSYLEMFLAFIQEKCTPPKGRKTLNYLLNYCAWIGDADKVARCLELGADPNYLHLETSSLSLACKEGHTSVVTKLLEHPGIDMNKPDYRGDTPMISAICCHHPEVAAMLLSDPRCDLIANPSFLFGTPLMAAVNFDYPELAQQIIESDRCGLNLETPTLLLAIQKGEAWNQLFFALLEKGIDVNADCSAFYEWRDSSPEWLMQEASAQYSPFSGLQYSPVIGDSRYLVFDRPIWAALHSDNRNAMKWLLGLGARLDAPSESFLRIDEWYRALLITDERKAFIANIHENAGCYALMDYLWDCLLEFREDASGIIYALQNEGLDRFATVAEYVETKRGMSPVFSRYAEIIYAAYHGQWQDHAALWGKHANLLLVDRGMKTLYGETIQEAALYPKLRETIREQLGLMIRQKIQDHCASQPPERASFSEDDMSSVSISGEDVEGSAMPQTIDETAKAFDQSFKLMTKSYDARAAASADGPVRVLTDPASKSSFLFHKPLEPQAKFADIPTLIRDLTVDHPLFTELYRLLGVTHVAARPRDVGKILAAIKGILAHDYLGVSWHQLQAPSSYYLCRMWRKEGKLEQFHELCRSCVHAHSAESSAGLVSDRATVTVSAAFSKQ